MKGKRLISLIACMACMMAVSVFSAGCGADKQVKGEMTDSSETALEDTKTGSFRNTEDNVYQDSSTMTVQDFSSKAAPDHVNYVSKPDFTGRVQEKFIETEYTPVKYEKRVKPYTIKSDLSNIVNLKQYGSFSQDQRKLLSQNGFVVAPTKEEQLFYIYENNQYLLLPSFITTDSVLQVYHIFFDYSLRTLELQSLLGILEQLNDDMLNKSIYIYNSLKNPEVKAEALMNIAYFGVAQLALQKELPDSIPETARGLAEMEYALMLEESGFKPSNIFGFKLDYSQYRPRGHYTRSDEFQRYFRAMMWYGQAPFPLYKEVDGKKVPDVKMTARALLNTCCIFMNYNGVSDVSLWEKIYNPTDFYVGSTDDLNIFHYRDLILKVYGSDPELDGLMDDNKMTAVFEEAKKLPEPQIQAKWVTVDTPAGKQFRFMGQRYIPDSEILQNLVEPYFRPIPSGLDVMGVLGSDRAYDILIKDYKVSEQWPLYPEYFQKLKDRFSKLSEDKWRSNMYYGWLWTLGSLLEPAGKGYPSFMTAPAWIDKSLNTALGSWSELRHDTILYGKQSGAESGGGDEPPVIKSYVEPNVELYERLLWLTRYSRENLTLREILPVDLESKMEEFERLLDFLVTCSVKELRNEELADEEYYRLFTYGAELELLTSSLAENGMRWFEITSETDKNMAVIADVHTAKSRYLEAGVGTAAQMFVVVPIGGKLYLTRGAVFSYYEFVGDKRLTDEEWQKMLKENNQPDQPQWMGTFQAGEKAELPVPTEPYDSGF